MIEVNQCHRKRTKLTKRLNVQQVAGVALELLSLKTNKTQTWPRQTKSKPSAQTSLGARSVSG